MSLFPESETSSIQRSYRVLSRRYRPAFFRDVMGQDPFVFMIQNALRRPELPGGILLTGTRGVGKTTIARLIAKTLTCQNLESQKQNQDLEPCGTCSSCQDCARDSHLDILEIDAASHTGVEDMRQILESCQYGTLGGGTYRVYIIDEVHMLSKSAFNALLKTLEEPPPHVLFIFATTEAHRIPGTILSRCQQFSLRRVDVSVLADHLKQVCQKEGYVASDEVCLLLARHGQGSVRDALSLLERAVLLSGTNLQTSLIRTMLGLPEVEQIHQLLVDLGDKNIDRLLDVVRGMYGQGADLKIVLEHIAQGFYQIMLMHMAPASLGSDHSSILEGLKDKFAPERIASLWQMTLRGIEEASVSAFPLVSLEMTLMRMVHVQDLPSVESLIDCFVPGKDEHREEGSKGEESKRKSVAIAQEILDRKKLEHPLNAAPGQNVRPVFKDFLAYIDLQKEALMYAQLTAHAAFQKWDRTGLYLVWLGKGDVPKELSQKLSRFLEKWLSYHVDVHWQTTSDAQETMSWAQQEAAKHEEDARQILKHPLAQELQKTFPDLTLEKPVKIQ